MKIVLMHSKNQEKPKKYPRVGSLTLYLMKNKFVTCAVFSFLCLSMASCYTLSYTVGNGPQTGVMVVEKNHYVVAGLAPIKVSDPVRMAGDAKNYQVTVTHTFVDGLINVLSSGFYTPTTTIVKK